MPMYRISGADGSVRRKVLCPEGQIDMQLTDGEAYEEIDPLVDGFGLTVVESDNISGALIEHGAP